MRLFSTFSVNANLLLVADRRRMLRRDEYLMRESTEVGEGDDLVSVRRTKSRKPCHRLVRPTGVGAQEAEAPGRICCGISKSINRVVMAI